MSIANFQNSQGSSASSWHGKILVEGFLDELQGIQRSWGASEQFETFVKIRFDKYFNFQSFVWGELFKNASDSRMWLNATNLTIFRFEHELHFRGYTTIPEFHFRFFLLETIWRTFGGYLSARTSEYQIDGRKMAVWSSCYSLAFSILGCQIPEECHSHFLPSDFSSVTLLFWRKT